MTDDELEAIRDRIGDSQAQTGADVLTLLAEVFRLRALVGEPEWEYGRQVSNGAVFVPVLAEDDDPSLPLVRRRKAGPWEPVPETERSRAMSEPVKYRNKPVVIEAMVLTDTNAGDVARWINGSGGHAVVRGGPRGGSINGTVIITTLEGNMTAQVGDMVIRGAQGEFHPCKPDIFTATYEPEGVQ